MIRKSLVTAGLLALVGLVPHRLAAQLPGPVEMLTFDASGLILPVSQQKLDSLTRQPPPTDIFIFAHGWLTSFREAQNSYETLRQRVDAVGTRFNLWPDNFRPLLIGIHWPSKAWDDDKGALRSASVNPDVDLSAIYSVLPASKSPATYEADVLTLQELLSKPEASLTEDDYRIAQAIFGRYTLSSDSPEDLELFNLSAARLSLPRLSIKEAFRVFTYWQMKERAGLVGANGVRAMLDTLQRAFPETAIHLFGHSFGCKLALSATAAATPLSRKLDTLALLQGAVAYRALNDDGGYGAVRGRVSGPIVATYSELDSALGVPYVLASRLADQSVERAASIYSALGRVGADVGQKGSLVDAAASDAYRFQTGVYSLNGTQFITGHSELFHEAVARMLLAAVFAQPNPADQRAAELVYSDAAADAREAAGPPPEGEDKKTYLAKFGDELISKAIGSLRDGRAAGGSLSVPTVAEASNRWKSFIEQPLAEHSVFVDNMYHCVVKGELDKAIPWIVGGSDDTTESGFPQCVAVGIRERSSGRAWSWIGSGTVILDGGAVLTAAHVKPRRDMAADRVNQRYEYAVFVGENTNEPKPDDHLVICTRRDEHPDYQSSDYKHDLAVLILSEKLTKEHLRGMAPPAIVGSNSWPADDEDAMVFHIVGFGSADGSVRFDGRRRRAQVPIVPLEYTDDQAKTLGCHKDLEVVAGNLGLGVDTCFGDSGGPALVFLNSSRSFALFGVTSRAVAGRERPCGDGGIYVRAAKYLDWITGCAEGGAQND